MPQITRDLRAFEDSLWLRLYHDVLPQTLGVTRVYDQAGKVIETHEQTAWQFSRVLKRRPSGLLLGSYFPVGNDPISYPAA
jgi:hypothetical protein